VGFAWGAWVGGLGVQVPAPGTCTVMACRVLGGVDLLGLAPACEVGGSGSVGDFYTCSRLAAGSKNHKYSINTIIPEFRKVPTTWYQGRLL
jgi:hypothetical protein